MNCRRLFLNRFTFCSKLPFRTAQYNIQIRNLDPPYLSAKPPIPLYPELQFDIKCRDFVILEQFCTYLRRFLSRLGLDVYVFALPAKLTTYRLYQPNSTNVRTTFELSDYHRVVRLNGLKAIHLPLLVDLVHQNLPEGVELSLSQSDPKSDDARYVPQLELYALKEELVKLSKAG
ncbi:hypothetical protein CRM22_009146 [Opisthorchis felineus]|uniref:Small ribosomal subunit protein uS10 domain-containing protein n=1 Tax=Opisthorchis felineus TaxID=147828 RepID=A0A4S2L8P4_OPIFE|nr:hypothetical protein CRM22_009146 [Opisthorchis felineus]